MKAAGCIVVGKTNLPEFGLGSHTYNTLFGTTVNAGGRVAGGEYQSSASSQYANTNAKASASGSSEPSNMCEPNRLACPAARRRRVSASSGRMNLSSLSAGQ